MNWRRSGLSWLDDKIEWLSQADASDAYAKVADFLSRSHYGLDPGKFNGVERLDAEEAGPEANAWLARRIGTGTVSVVFGEVDVCRMNGVSLLDHWQDMFCPSRDDVVIVPEEGSWVLFYCHEDEFEFGIKNVTRAS